MMTKEEFFEYLVERIPNSSIKEVKLPNKHYNGLMVFEENSFTPDFNIDYLYEQYLDGISEEKILNAINDKLNVLGEMAVESGSFGTEFNVIKPKLFIRVSNADWNKEFLKSVPHVMIWQLHIMLRFPITKMG